MGRVPDGGRAGAPIRAEIFVIWLDGDRIKLTGPAGAQPWILAIDAGCHPAELVEQAVRDRIGEPLLLHSTSWRHEDAAVTLSFVAVMERSHVEGMASRPIRRSELARADATEPPDEVDPDAVVEHALRHLAWLVQDDPVVRDRLPDRWKAALASYVPEPFRNLA